MTPWTIQTVRQLLDQAKATVDGGGKYAADRLIEHGQLHSALSWLVTQHATDAKQHIELAALASSVVSSTREFSTPAIPSSKPFYSIRHRARFDRAIRALIQFLQSMAHALQPGADPSTRPE